MPYMNPQSMDIVGYDDAVYWLSDVLRGEKHYVVQLSNTITDWPASLERLSYMAQLQHGRKVMYVSRRIKWVALYIAMAAKSPLAGVLVLPKAKTAFATLREVLNTPIDIGTEDVLFMGEPDMTRFAISSLLQHAIGEVDSIALDQLRALETPGGAN